MEKVYFDLDLCMNIYSFLGIKKSWFDYSYTDRDGWDEEKFYDDFDKLWNELPSEKKSQITEQLKLN